MSETPRTAWPSESLARELRELNRANLRDSHDPQLQGRESWPNQQKELFAEELALAQSLGISPISPDQPEFMILLNRNERFNWAVLLNGSLRVSPSIVMTDDGPNRISHAVLCYNGGDVLAAGEGRAGEYLSNTTGHYKNEAFVLAPVIKAFAHIGVDFKR